MFFGKMKPVFGKTESIFNLPDSSRRKVLAKKFALKCTCRKKPHLHCVLLGDLTLPYFCVFMSCSCGRSTLGRITHAAYLKNVECAVINEWNNMKDGRG